jgi:SET domain-containing protein
LSPSQLEAGYKFNCRFSIFPEDKIDIRLIALRDIQAGEELLASYGSAFVIE